MRTPLSISCYRGGEDAAMFRDIINQGIDARLEAFTRSTFHESDRLDLEFHPTEISILLRRLSESESDYASVWESNIVEVCYGVEVRS